MAVTRKTQKDIGNYEPKFIGPFTIRVFCFTVVGVLIGGIVGFFIYSYSLGEADTITIAVFPVIIAAAFALFGKAKPYGMKAEDYLKQTYLYRIQSPPVRAYKTETVLDHIKLPEENEETDKENSSKKKTQSKPVHKPDKEYPDYK